MERTKAVTVLVSALVHFLSKNPFAPQKPLQNFLEKFYQKCFAKIRFAERTCAKKEYFKKSFIIAVLGIFVLIALAAPATAAERINITEQWNMTFGGAGDDYGYSVQQTADGGYILAGDTRSYGAGDADIWLIKTDSNGNEQWNRTSGGAEADLLDRGSVRQTSDGGYVITGHTYSYGAGDADVWLIKTNQNGIEQWNRTFGGEGLDWGHSVRQTSDGGYVIAGRIIPPSAGARADAWLIKTDSNGVEQWNRTFGADGCEYAASVQQTADGGYIMTGRTTSFDALEADAWLIRTDSNGIEQWNRTFGGTGYDYGYSVQQTADGGYVIAGSTNGRDDVWLIKTHPDGTEEWNTIFGGTAKDEGYSIQQTTDGGYIVTGYTESYGTAGSADVWLIRTDSNGIEQWNMTVGGTGTDEGYSVQQTADGDYIAAGYTNSFGAGGYDLWLIKLSTPIVWQYEGLINPIDAERLSSGNTLITEFGNHSVIEVKPDKQTVWRYGDGTAGSGENQLNCPVDAERLASGSTLITDRSNHRVIEVTPVKEIVWQYGTTGESGSGADQLHNPMDAERLSNGNTLIADRLNNRVIEVNESKGIVWQYGITNPFDADRLSNNNTLIVEYTNHRVIEVNSTGVVVWQYGTGTEGSGVNQLDYPEDAERLSNGNTLITDSLNHRVIEVTPAKEIVWQYGTTGTAGSGANELNHPRDAERLPEGNTLIADWGNSRVIEVRGASEEEEEEIDLLPTALETPPTMYANLSNTISATIKNNGTGDAPSFNVSLSADGSPVNKEVVSGLGAGESTAVSLSWTPSRTGDFELCVAADCNFEVNESNEGNNVLCENVTVLPFEIDLLPTALETPSTPYDNFTNTIRATIKNNGTGDASSLFNVSLSADGSPVDEVGVSGLDAGESKLVSFSWTPSSTGDFELCVAADCDLDVVESEEDNNVLCKNVTVLSFEHPCWNDTFDDETKIAEMQKVVVSEGDVKIDLENVSWIWESDPLLVAGLGTANNPTPAIAFNITGDERWNLIVGEHNWYSGFYWDGTQWIENPSSVSGLAWHTETSGYLSPAIAFNVTGDGRWNLIDAEAYPGHFYAYYWNGTQWIENSSLVAGLEGVGSSPKPAIAFNITGDGNWNLICGEYRKYGGIYHGFYWNGTQWIRDDRLVSGLETGSKYASPSIAFNLAGDEKWNLIGGEHPGFHGFYWNDSAEQWISEPSLVSGLGAIYVPQPVIAFNVTGDEVWNLIAGEGGGDNKGFYGYQGFIEKLSITSDVIQPSFIRNWVVFNANDTIPDETSITYKILDEKNNTIMSVVPGQDISSISQPSIRLYAELTTDSFSKTKTPVLHDWSVYWETGAVDLLPTAIETPAKKMYPTVTFNISAAVKNNGDAHSGRFNAALYANETNVDTKLIEDIPAGDSINVTFEWTPTEVGNYTLTVIVDSDGAIAETNEENNELTKEVTVLPTNVRRLTFDTNSSINPNIATDSEGNIHVVWRDDLGEGSGLYYKKLAPNGTVLADDKMVSPGSGSRIAVDSSDEVHVVFNNGTNSINVSYVKLDNLGNTLIEPKQVISGVCYRYCGTGYAEWNPAKPCGIAVDGSGEVHVVACCNCGRLKSSNSQDLKYAKLDNEGNKLVNYTIEHLTAPGLGPGVRIWDCMDKPSSVAVDSEGNAYTAYTKGLCGCCNMCGDFNCGWPSCLEAYYVKIDGEGVHKQELTGDLPLPSLYPSVCVDSADNKYVVWSQHNRTATIVNCGIGCRYRMLYGFDFYLTKFDKSGNKVIDRKRLTFEDYPVESGRSEDGQYYVYGVRRPVIDTESGVIHAAWSVQDTITSFWPPGYVSEPETGEDNNMWYMAFDTSGGEMTNKTLISFEDGNSWEPDIDAVQDGAHLVWTDNRDENKEIYYARIELQENRVFILCPSDKWTVQNVTATYAIGIVHTMPGSETFNLTLDDFDGADVAELNKSTITLDPNTIGEVILNVTDAVLGDYRVKVSVESQTNPGIMAECTVTTSVITPKPDLVITAIDAYHNNTAESPWFNLSNEVDVEVKNVGTADAGAFNVSLYADGEFVDGKNVSGLETGNSTLVQFKWTPVGADCFKHCTFTDTSRDYNLTVVADCDNEVNESDATNNNLTEVEKACYNGYMADEPLENVFHGTLRGGLLFTTGDGTYGGLYSVGSTRDTHYEITIPAGASVVLARLNVYYTWHYEKESCPAMEVSITNATGTYVVPLDRDYNDIKCQRLGVAWVFPWGNYVYNLTPHIQGSGTYTVTVKRTGGPSFCIAAPGIEVLYKDENKPLIEYWINEGADVLIGGRRSDGGYLSVEECINNATFPGNVELSKVKNATLGVVSPWAGTGWTPGTTNYLFFNDIVLGQGVYHGYSETYSEIIDGISMHIGSTNAQVGVNVTDVTDYLLASDNRVGQGDDGDNMMPCNAFLVVEYEPLTAFKVYGWVNDSIGAPVLNPNVTITNLNTAEVFIAETNASSNYYQVVTSSENVSAGNVLRFYASDNGNKTEFNHVVTQEEKDTGGFEQNITIVPGVQGACGDVTGDGKVRMSDGRQIYLNQTYPGMYPVDEWAADVTGDGKVRMSDGRQIYLNQTYPGMYPLGCCEI